MHAVLTEDQRSLVDVAGAWLTERFPVGSAAAVADARPGWEPSLWAELAELGWLALDVAEQDGGTGATLVEVVLLAELAGRHLLPAPVVSTWSALPLARHDEQLLDDIVAGRRSVAVTSPGGLTADLGAVTDVLVLDGGTASLVRAEDCRIVDEPTVDGTRRRGRLEAAPAGRRLATVAETDVWSVQARRSVLIAAESVGVGQRCLDLAVEHARLRHQFGRPIGSFQAVGFALADVHLALDRARSLAYWAAWQLVHGRPTADQAATGARITAVDTAVRAAETSLQTFGGIGMTWDAPLHRWYKRALVNQSAGGPDGPQLDRIATWLTGEGW